MKTAKSMMTSFLFLLLFCDAAYSLEKDFVIIDTSAKAFTIFIGVPESMFNDIKPNLPTHPSIEIIHNIKLHELSDKYITSNLIKNDYKDINVKKVILNMINNMPMTPIGLTWNGGIAISSGDYEHAKTTYNNYTDNSVEYERTKNNDPKTDPNNPINFKHILKDK